MITTIIASQLWEGTFSIFGFWKRRIRRLYPALVVVAAVSLLIGELVLVQPERGICQSSARSDFFLSKYLSLADHRGYWSPAADNILLLHTWSLSLEEQFYVIFPLILFVVIHWFRRGEFWILGALLILKYGNAPGWVSAFLSLKPIVYIGKISYSLYLAPGGNCCSQIREYGGALRHHSFGDFACAMASYRFHRAVLRYGLKRPRLTIPLTGAAAAACVLPILILPSSPLLKDLGNINSKEALKVGGEYAAAMPLRRGKVESVWSARRGALCRDA